MDPKQFASRIAHCTTSWNHTKEYAIKKCDILENDKLSESQKNRVQERRRFLLNNDTNELIKPKQNKIKMVKRSKTTKLISEMKISKEYVVQNMVFKVPNKRQRLINALREANQKRIMNLHAIKQKKKMQVQSYDTHKFWKCPNQFCNNTVNRLTAAHCGITAKKIIEEIIDNNPNDGFLELDDKVMQAHQNVNVIICCDVCNKYIEDKNLEEIGIF